MLKAALTSASSGSAPIPLDGTLHVDYEGRSGVATVGNTFVRTPRTRVDINGAAGQRMNLRAHVHAADLREMDSLAAAFQTSGTSNSTNTASRSSINLAGVAELRSARRRYHE